MVFFFFHNKVVIFSEMLYNGNMIKDVRFIKSGTDFRHFPEDNKNEYLFLGRSNVGKSSLINFLTGRKNLARTSKTPGKTILLNFFLINEEFYLVDSPGYGYARRSKKQIEEFGKMFEGYVTKRNQLQKAFLLVDYKVGPTEDDLIMYNYLRHFNLNIVIIATKVDKLNQKERNASKKRFKEHFKHEKVILTSTTKNIGLKELLLEFEEEK